MNIRVIKEFLFQLLFVYITLHLPRSIAFAAPPNTIKNCKTGETITGYIYELDDNPNFVRTDIQHNTAKTKYSGIESADFNGDGYTDLLLTDFNSGKLTINLSENGQILQEKLWQNTPTPQNPHQLLVTDFDGDQCSDILFQDHEQFWKLALSNCKDSFNLVQTTLPRTLSKTNQIVAYKPNNKNCPSIITCQEEENTNIYICQIYNCTTLGNYSLGKETSAYGKILAADIHGDGLDSLLTQHYPKELRADILRLHNGWYWSFTQHEELNANLKTWSTFPGAYSWSKSITGDFNGDGKSDIISYSNSLLGWWIGLSNGNTALEIPARGLPELHADSLIIEHGDINGDGIDEVIILSANHELAIYQWSKKKSLAGVDVFFNSPSSTQTDDNGVYTFTCITADTDFQLKVKHSDYTFSPSIRTISKSQNIKRPFNFVAEQSSKNNSTGGAIQLTDEKNGPYICLGYNPQVAMNTPKWLAPDIVDCPDNYAVMVTDLVDPNETTADKVLVSTTCCRLPSDDILLNGQNTFTTDSCPSGFVVTGTKQDVTNEKQRYLFRCTKINSIRYKLGQPTPGIAFGISTNKNYRSISLTRADIPLALRWGAQREDYNSWAKSGCLGQPWGSLLTAKNPGTCKDLSFTQLQYIGLTADPIAGSPVKIFPDCAKIDNIFDPRSGCQPNQTSATP